MYKQIIVIRADLKMGKGKLAAQCSHAALSAYKKAQHNEEYKTKSNSWEKSGGEKVVLKVQSEQELRELYEQAQRADIPCGEIIHDAGHTQLEPGTATCFATFPWEEEILDKIFGKLKLL